MNTFLTRNSLQIYFTWISIYLIFTNNYLRLYLLIIFFISGQTIVFTMGKVKRTRQKFHQAALKDNNNDKLSDSHVDSVSEQLIGKSPLLKTPEELAQIPDNLFEGIDINFDSLNKKLIEDDKISVGSIVKTCKYDSKGKLLKKKERLKLKHDLFMRSMLFMITFKIVIKYLSSDFD